jgi:hypothetical protein
MIHDLFINFSFNNALVYCEVFEGAFGNAVQVRVGVL